MIVTTTSAYIYWVLFLVEARLSGADGALDVRSAIEICGRSRPGRTAPPCLDTDVASIRWAASLNT